MQNQIFVVVPCGNMRILRVVLDGMSRLRTEGTVPYSGEHNEELVLREQCHGPNSYKIWLPQWNMYYHYGLLNICICICVYICFFFFLSETILWFVTFLWSLFWPFYFNFFVLLPPLFTLNCTSRPSFFCL